MNESLLMSLCCRDNVNLIIQRAGTSAFAFLTSHDVGALFFFSSLRSALFVFVFVFFHVTGCHSPSAASDCFCVLFSKYFMMNMYVPLCMSFDIILWILSV